MLRQLQQRSSGRAPKVGVLADFRSDHDVCPVGAERHPVSNDGFGFPAGVAVGPGRITICSVYEVAAFSDESIQDIMGLLLVGGPTKGVATEGQWVDGQV